MANDNKYTKGSPAAVPGCSSSHGGMMTRLETKRSTASPRWGVWQRHWVEVGGEPFLDRRQVIQTPWCAVLLTRIYQIDGRDPHDHSRWFASWIISGRYQELVYDNPADLSDRQFRSHRRWSWYVLRTDQAHRIIGLRQPLWTLVVAGRHRGTWSFWTPDGKVDWKIYDKEQ